jgi:hypothetical protein
MTAAVEALETELLDLVVVVLAVEDVPLLRAFDDDLPLRSDLQPSGGVELRLFHQQLFERLAGLLPDGVAVFKKVALGDLGEESATVWASLLSLSREILTAPPCTCGRARSLPF